MWITEKKTPPKSFHLAFLAILFFLAGGLFFVTICACLMLVSNATGAPREPLDYTVLEFSACTGWSDFGSVEKQQIFKPDEEYIFACGRIETNRPIFLHVYWYHEGQEIYRDTIGDVEDQFISELPSRGKGFLEGKYELRLVIGRETEGRTEFKVAHP